MRKKPHATVTITAKLPLKLAEKWYEDVVNSDYEGNVSATMRAAIELQLKHHEGALLKAVPQSM